MGAEPSLRVRRAPAPFRPVTVVQTELRTPHLLRLTLQGTWLGSFVPPLPAGSVRLLIPELAGAEPARLAIPVWDRNIFVYDDGRRAVIRTLTPLRHDAAAAELDVEVVLHDDGPLSEWARRVVRGDPTALSGPGRGYAVVDDGSSYVIAGDESAIPAIGQLLAALPPSASATVLIEITHTDARLTITDRADVEVRWLDRDPGSPPGTALVPSVADVEITPATRVWIAGEAAAVHRIRQHLFTTVGVSRGRATVRGYWKHGRSASSADDDPD